MEEYRICLVAGGQINQRIEFGAPNDQAAVEYARQVMNHDDAVEWDLERVVGKLKPATP